MDRFWIRTLGVLLAAVAISAGANPARAAYVVYTDRASFNAATILTATLDFEEVTDEPFSRYDTPAGLTLSGVNFQGILDVPGPHDIFSSTGYLFTVDPSYDPIFNSYSWGSGRVLAGPDGAHDPVNDVYSGHILVTLSPGVTAIGVDLMTFDPFADSVDILFANGDSFSVPTLDNPNRAFFGYTSDSAISSITFRSHNPSFLNMDNFSFGEVNPTPAPAGVVLFGLGFAGLGMLRSFRNGKSVGF